MGRPGTRGRRSGSVAGGGRRLGDARFREAALAAAGFMLRERLEGPPEVMLLTYGGMGHANVEVGFEGLMGGSICSR
ncbi:MAG: hypothetical protein U0841_33110 [Chloroflexia bacterium]